MDIPIDASPKYRQRCEFIKAAIDKHGTHNSYYLYNAHCVYHMLNDANFGAVDFRFEGVVLTGADDQTTAQSDLRVELASETCDWLTEPVKEWFAQSVPHAVKVEFDKYIAAGDLDKTRERIEKIEAASDEAGGFVGMYL